MKKYLKYLLSLAVVCTIASCTKTVTLDDSVDNRVNKVITGYIEELSSAENGWIANIMTDEGVYRFWLDFTNNNVVEMYTDNLHYPEYKNLSQSTTYNIRSLLLPTLSFDTYSYIHIPNDPDNNISFGTGENVGLNTDFEFEIYGYKDDVFTLKGRMSRVDATMTRATSEEKVAVQSGNLMGVLEDAKAYKKGQYLGTKIGGTDVSVRFGPNPRKVMLAWKDTDGSTRYISAYTYTNLNRDVILNEMTLANGSPISAFRWNDSSKTYTTEMPDGTTSPVYIQDTPIVSLYDLLGGGKAFSTMITAYDMYAKKDATTEELAQLKKDNVFFAHYVALSEFVPQIFIYDSDLAQIQFEFYNSSNGRPNMRITIVAHIYLPEGGYQPLGMPYSFQLVPDDANGRFTVGTTATPEEDISKDLAAAPAIKTFLDFFKQKTFQVEWSQLDYGSELMGKLRFIPTGVQSKAEIQGAIFE